MLKTLAYSVREKLDSCLLALRLCGAPRSQSIASFMELGFSS